MKNLFKYLIVCVVFFACSGKNIKIDGTDANTFATTKEKIAEHLNSLEKEKFNEAITIIFEYEALGTNDEDKWQIVRRKLNGKNAEEIFTFAETIATREGISWNRNQAPVSGGIPKPQKNELEPAKDSIKSGIARMDFDTDLDGDNVLIYPLFYGDDNKVINFSNSADALVEIYSNGTLIHSIKGNVTGDNTPDGMYNNSYLSLPINLINPKKIQSDQLSILVRIRKDQHYYSQKKNIKIPQKFVGGGEINAQDSIEQSSDTQELLAKSIANRFLNNISAGNFAGAFALSKSPSWKNMEAFNKKFADFKNGKSSGLELNQKTSTQINFSGNYQKQAGSSANSISVKLEKINNKWFVVDVN